MLNSTSVFSNLHFFAQIGDKYLWKEGLPPDCEFSQFFYLRPLGHTNSLRHPKPNGTKAKTRRGKAGGRDNSPSLQKFITPLASSEARQPETNGGPVEVRGLKLRLALDFLLPFVSRQKEDASAA